MSEQIVTKRCSKCKEFKPFSEFYKDKSRKDGFYCKCKSCCKLYTQSDRGKAAILKGVKKYQKTEKGKAVFQAAIKRYYARQPNYIKAVNAVNHAIQAGKLPRPDSLPCHYCPAQADQYHHWHGYGKEHWLDVVSACKKCHRKCHKKVS